MLESKLVVSFSSTANRGTTHSPPGKCCQLSSCGTQWSSFLIHMKVDWKQSEDFLFKYVFYTTWSSPIESLTNSFVLFTCKMLPSSLLPVYLISDVTFKKLHFNWLFNIYLSPTQKRICQKFDYLNFKYSIKINAVWQPSQDTFTKQQKTDFPYEANATWFFLVCFIK